MEPHPTCGRPSERGQADSFPGTVWLGRLVVAPAPARVRAGRVTFTPGARTAWHTHPLGQTLHVLTGRGLAQARGGRGRAPRRGATVWPPPGGEHWPAAAPDCVMVHLA